jgi:hypothetical protein
VKDAKDKFRQIADRKGEFTNDKTERLLMRIEGLPVDEQILEVKRTLAEDQSPGDIIGSIAFTAWLKLNQERIVELLMEK